MSLQPTNRSQGRFILTYPSIMPCAQCGGVMRASCIETERNTEDFVSYACTKCGAEEARLIPRMQA